MIPLISDFMMMQVTPVMQVAPCYGTP